MLDAVAVIFTKRDLLLHNFTGRWCYRMPPVDSAQVSLSNK